MEQKNDLDELKKWFRKRNGIELRERKYSQATIIECSEADKGSTDSAALQD